MMRRKSVARTTHDPLVYTRIVGGHEERPLFNINNRFGFVFTRNRDRP